MKLGDKVEKVGGDYTFVGYGVLHVYSEKNLKLAENS